MAKVKNFDVLIACDPELFVKDKKTQKLVSAHNLVPGTKEHPFRVEGGGVEVDGMALEFIIDPSENGEQFNNNIDSVMNSLRRMVPNHDFFINPVAEFGAKYIQEQPEDAKRLGCMPDFNAYTGKANPTPDANADFRTASGHIHISWKDPTNKKWADEIDPFEPTHFEACCMLTKTLDAFLGIPSIAWDKDVKRRKLYGQAGSFRPKSYGKGYHGMEYRPLSNLWLNYPQTRDLVYHNTLEAINAIFNDYNIPEKQYYGESAADILNNAHEKKMQDIAARVLRSGEIKSPAHYRELREKKVA